MLSFVVLFSQRLPGRPCIFSAISQPSSSQAHPASIARRSLGCLESHTRQTPVLHFSTHFSPLPATFVPLSLVICLLFMSSQPTPGSIQFFYSFSSHSQPCLFSFHCFPWPCAAISLDPCSVTLPSFQSSVVSPFFP